MFISLQHDLTSKIECIDLKRFFGTFEEGFSSKN